MKIKAMRFILLIFFVTICPVCALAQSGDKIFNAEFATLENGMEVIAIPNDRVPVVTHMVWYKVGAVDEKPGQSGLAHFVEHLMFKGTEKVPGGEFSKIINRLGGNHNAFTSQNVTAYFQTIAREHLRTVMELEADRMVNLTFPEEDVNSERLVVLEERRQRTENDPRGYFFEQMNTLLFPNHPYGNPVIGWLHEMEALSRENVMQFYNDWYAPNNAVLIVGGDITMDELLPLARDIYGAIPSRKVKLRTHTKVPPLPASPFISYQNDTIKQPSFRRLYRVPSANMDKDESLALEVLSEIMGGSATTRLYKSLVIDQKIATGTDFSYDPTSLYDSRLYIGATPSENVSLEDLERAVEKEISRLLNEGINEEELTAAKRRMIESAIFARDSISGPAMIVGHRYLTGSTMDDIEYWPQRIEKVTAVQINEVARKYLGNFEKEKRFYVTGHLMPLDISPNLADKNEGTVE